MMHILWPDSPAPDRLFGGKAAALRAQVGMPIPPWFCLPPTAFDEQGCLLVDCAEALDRIGPGPYAVRSSAADEDGGSFSFAGQLQSLLGIEGPDVAAAAERVWASHRSDAVTCYRREHQLGPAQPPTVLVQRQVCAEAAGVAFAVDPVSGSWDRAIVAAVPGLGESLVDGRSDADHWQVDRHARIQARSIAAGKIAYRWRQGALRMTDPMDVPCLDDRQVRAIAELARRCSDRAGRPQDIEWAVADGAVFLLQSRPITTLDNVPDPAGAPRLWDNSNIAESYAGMTTPLTFTFARDAYTAVYRQFCRLMGVDETSVASLEPTFRNMLGLSRGRMYYNLLSWYRMLASLPGFRFNRGFMEQMMGLREGLPEDLAAGLGQVGVAERLADGWKLLASLRCLWRNHRHLDRQMRRFRRRLHRELREPTIPWSRQSPDELVASYRQLEDALLERWDAPLVNDFFAMIFYGVLAKCCTAWCGDADGSLQNDLIGGAGDVISAEPARRVRAMADLVRPHPPLARALRLGNRQEIEAALTPSVSQAFQAYLQRFADRCLEELKLESPTLSDDPMPLYRAVGHMAARPADLADSGAGLVRRQRVKAERRAFRALAWSPVRQLLFRYVLRHARSCVANRENLRFERTQVFGRVRRIMLELGRRFTAAGVLDRPEHVFWLEQHEVFGFVDGSLSCPNLRALAAARRETFAGFAEQAVPADRFRTTGWPFCGNDPTDPATQHDAPADERTGSSDDDACRQGKGACPGQVEGTVRVVRDPRGVELPADTILVAERTDPGWIMLFPAAKALVVERGSLLSHSAIVARELGLPCVVGVQGATSWLADGDRVVIDGSTGQVRRCTPAEVRQ